MLRTVRPIGSAILVLAVALAAFLAFSPRLSGQSASGFPSK